MTTANSPTYARGRLDGEADTMALSACPPGVASGPNPPFPAYPVMYMRGYGETFLPSPCACDGSCRRGKQRGEAPDEGQR
jgi:hypothetical protein